MENKNKKLKPKKKMAPWTFRKNMSSKKPESRSGDQVTYQEGTIISRNTSLSP